MRRSPQPVSESLIPTRFSFPSSPSSFPLAFVAKLARSRARTINEKKWTSMKSHEISLHINQTYWLTRNDLLFLLMLSSCRTKYLLCSFFLFFFFLKKRHRFRSNLRHIKSFLSLSDFRRLQFYDRRPIPETR